MYNFFCELVGTVPGLLTYLLTYGFGSCKYLLKMQPPLWQKWMQITATVKPRKLAGSLQKFLLPAVHFHRPCFSCVKCECWLFLSSSFMNLWPPAISRAARCQCVPSPNYAVLWMLRPPWPFLCVNFTLVQLHIYIFFIQPLSEWQESLPAN